MTRREFERIVEEAVRALPEEFRSRARSLHIKVAETPPRRPPGPSPYGYFEGVSRSRKPPLLSDRITLFKRAIERDCQTRPDLVKCVQETVLHELGHALGSC